MSDQTLQDGSGEFSFYSFCQVVYVLTITTARRILQDKMPCASCHFVFVLMCADIDITVGVVAFSVGGPWSVNEHVVSESEVKYSD